MKKTLEDESCTQLVRMLLLTVFVLAEEERVSTQGIDLLQNPMKKKSYSVF